MRDIFIETLSDLVEKHPEIILIAMYLIILIIHHKVIFIHLQIHKDLELKALLI